MNLFDETPIAPRHAMPRLGIAQRNRLLELSGRVGASLIWDGTGAVPHANALVVVLEPANAPRVEALIRSLGEGSIIVVPCAELPAFDPLKAKLVPHGVIGADGAEAPHQMWWGGLASLTSRTGLYSRAETLFVSCYPQGTVSELMLARWRCGLDLLTLDNVVEDIPRDRQGRPPATGKIDFIIEQLDANQRPVFWIDPTAFVRQHPVLPQTLACDVAFQRLPGGDVETRALFVRPTDPTRALLEVWRRMTLAYPQLPESFLFDQAWIATTAQRPLETAFLPTSYGQSDRALRDATIELDSIEPPPAVEASNADYPRVIRRFGRPVAPEPCFIMRGPTAHHRPITLAIRDEAAPATRMAAMIESISAAFAYCSGGFSRLEITLCGSRDEFDAVMQLDEDGWVMLTDANPRFELAAFAQLSDRVASMELVSSSTSEPEVPAFATVVGQFPRWRQITRPRALLKRSSTA